KEILRLGFRSLITLPLFANQEIVGTLTMYAAESNFFDEEELALLKELAANVSFALEHIEKEAQVARLSRIQAVMGNINALIVRARDHEELFRESCRIAVEAGGFRMAWLGIVDRTEMRVKPVAWHGAQPEFLTFIKDRFSLRDDEQIGNTMSARAVREKKAFVSN